MRINVYFTPAHRALAQLLVCAALAFSQTRTPGEQAPTSDSVRVPIGQVNLLCTVQDPSGIYVNNLSQEDFVALEDGQPQPITHFERQTDQALTVALLLDVSFSMDTSLSAETDNARQFFRRILRPGDRAMLAGFAAAVNFWQPVTSSRQELEETFDEIPEVVEALRKERMPLKSMVRTSGGLLIRSGGDGGSLFYDALDMVSIRQLRHLSGRKAIIALTDGEDDGSERTLKDAVRSTLQANAVFFGIDTKEQTGVGMDILKELSWQTGGSAFYIDNHTTLDAALRAAEEQLHSQYAIEYAPPDNSTKGNFHKTEVRVNKPGVTVRVRSGYYR